MTTRALTSLERRARQYFLVAAGAIVLTLIAILLYRHNPAVGGTYLPCPFRAVTGYLCAGCGSLRATHQLLHLRLGAAWALNPAFVLALPLVAWWMARRLSGGRLPPVVSARRAWLGWAFVIALAAWWILRNVL